jgi:hypothetical protein
MRLTFCAEALPPSETAVAFCVTLVRVKLGAKWVQFKVVSSGVWWWGAVSG